MIMMLKKRLSNKTYVLDIHKDDLNNDYINDIKEQREYMTVDNQLMKNEKIDNNHNKKSYV